MCGYCGNIRNCRNWLQVQTLTVGSGQFAINIAEQSLNDGQWYTVRLDQAFPVLAGTETVFVVNGGQVIQLTDWRGRALLSERVLRHGERLRMVYSKNGISGLATFQVHEGIVPLP